MQTCSTKSCGTSGTGWLSKYEGRAKRNETPIRANAHDGHVLVEVLAQGRSRFLRQAGFGGITVFYAALSFRRWIAYV
jgi:hypothetical protein